MDLASASPLFDLFRRGEVPREVRLLAAQGAVAPGVEEQLAILVLLTGDRDPEIAQVARRTLDGLPPSSVTAFLGRHDVADEVRAYFRARGLVAAVPGSSTADGQSTDDVALTDLERELEAMLAVDAPGGDPSPDEAVAPDGEPGRRNIAMLPVIDRMKLAMRGTREQRAVLIRDANRLVSTSVLSSPKLTDAEVENFAKMANVSEDVLRIIGTNRGWTKKYSVLAALSRNPKTPPAISMPLVGRLNERDLKALTVDRNVPEGLRLSARKLLASSESRRR